MRQPSDHQKFDKWSSSVQSQHLTRLVFESFFKINSKSFTFGYGSSLNLLATADFSPCFSFCFSFLAWHLFDNCLHGEQLQCEDCKVISKEQERIIMGQFILQISSTMDFSFYWHPNKRYFTVFFPPTGSLNRLHWCLCWGKCSTITMWLCSSAAFSIWIGCWTIKSPEIHDWHWVNALFP